MKGIMAHPILASSLDAYMPAYMPASIVAFIHQLQALEILWMQKNGLQPKPLLSLAAEIYSPIVT